MDIFLIVLVVLAVVHFIYDSIIRPSLLVGLRHDLFILRDALRDTKVVKSEGCTPAAFDIVHAGINNLIGRLESLTVSLPVRVQSVLKADPSLKESVRARQQVVEASSCEDLLKIHRLAVQKVELAMMVNIGALFLYLVPVAVVAFAWAAITKFAKLLLTIPTSDANRLIAVRA